MGPWETGVPALADAAGSRRIPRAPLEAIDSGPRAESGCRRSRPVARLDRFDLGAPPDGFVDILILPEDPNQWPPVGHEGFFEILQHRPGQVRLFPTDPSMRSKGYRVSNWSREEWAAVTE